MVSRTVTLWALPTQAPPCRTVMETDHAPGPPLVGDALTLRPASADVEMLDVSPSGGVTVAEPLTEPPLPSTMDPPPEHDTDALAGGVGPMSSIEPTNSNTRSAERRAPAR